VPTPELPRSVLRARDLLPTGTLGLRSRKLRALLSGLGIAIGIAAIVAVLGVTRSSQADVLASIDRVGTNLLTVANGKTIQGAEAELPVTAGTAVARTGGVLASAATATLDLPVYRNDRIPSGRTGGLSVRVTDPALLTTLDGTLLDGRFLDAALARYPAVVLGHYAATSLGIRDVTARPQIYVGERWYTVVGILAPVELAPELDTSAMIGAPAATAHFGYAGNPTRIFVRAQTERTDEVAGLLGRATNPVHPEEVTLGGSRQWRHLPGSASHEEKLQAGRPASAPAVAREGPGARLPAIGIRAAGRAAKLATAPERQAAGGRGPAVSPAARPTAVRAQTSWSRIWGRARRSSREMCIWE